MNFNEKDGKMTALEASELSLVSTDDSRIRKPLRQLFAAIQNAAQYGYTHIDHWTVKPLDPLVIQTLQDMEYEITEKVVYYRYSKSHEYKISWKQMAEYVKQERENGPNPT